MSNNHKDKKSSSSYNWFLKDAKWDADEVAQRKAELFFNAINLKENDRLLLIIDDTYNTKKGKHTEGVGRFYDHSKGLYFTSFDFSICFLNYMQDMCYFHLDMCTTFDFAELP